jgi:hypothetical protein
MEGLRILIVNATPSSSAGRSYLTAYLLALITEDEKRALGQPVSWATEEKLLLDF